MCMGGPGFEPRWGGGGEIFLSCSDRLRGPPSLLYSGYRVFPRRKRPGRGVNHLPPSSAEVKERVKLCLYSPSAPSLRFVGRTVLLPFRCDMVCRDGVGVTNGAGICGVRRCLGVCRVSERKSFAPTVAGGQGVTQCIWGFERLMTFVAETEI
jgi:hypothetical protein